MIFFETVEKERLTNEIVSSTQRHQIETDSYSIKLAEQVCLTWQRIVSRVFESFVVIIGSIRIIHVCHNIL
jgi:hypothetical protein